MDALGVRVLMAETNLLLLQALHEILCESEEAETVRKALAAMTSTPEGIEYLRMNPLAL